MHIKHLPANLKLGTAFGTFLMILLTASPAPAQTGNQSDATGPIPSTSDIAGGAFSTTGGGTETVFQGGSSVQASVNQAGVSLASQLSANSLTTASGSAIPAPSQQSVLNLLTADSTTQASASINTITTALATGINAPPGTAVAELVSSLLGLLAEGKVSPQQLKNAITSYNELIRSSNAEFLSNPPAELIAIRVSLSRLIEAVS